MQTNQVEICLSISKLAGVEGVASKHEVALLSVRFPAPQECLLYELLLLLQGCIAVSAHVLPFHPPLRRVDGRTTALVEILCKSMGASSRDRAPEQG